MEENPIDARIGSSSLQWGAHVSGGESFVDSDVY